MLRAEQRWPWVDDWIRPCVAELLGTAIYVFVAVSTQVSHGVPGITAALVLGFTLTFLMVGMGHISGGHYNPGVTLGSALSGGVRPPQAVVYVLCQVIGGILGAAISRGCLDGDIWSSRVAYRPGIYDLYEHFTPGMMILCETVLSAILVLTFLMAILDSEGRNSLGPLAMGFAIVVATAAGGMVSGGQVNPARALGPLVVVSPMVAADSTYKPWNHHYVPWAGSLIGALLAVALYRLLLARNDKRLILKIPRRNHYMVN